MRYSLSDYKVTITFSQSSMSAYGITIGGQGSDKVTESISVSRSNSLYTTDGYHTGGYVHNQNLDKTGTVSINIGQLSYDCRRLSNIFKIYEGTNSQIGDPAANGTCTITVTDRVGAVVATCSDCVPVKQPDRSFASTAGNLTWSFNAGVIDFA